MKDERHDLARAVAYILWDNSKLIPRAKQRNGWRPSIEDYLGVAAIVIEQLDISGYGFIKRPLHREERRRRMQRVLTMLREAMKGRPS